MAEQTRIALRIEPLDVLFCGTGQPFGPAAKVQSGLPTPQAVAGALRTWLLSQCGTNFGALGRSLRAGASFAAAASDQGQDPARVARLAFHGPWFTRDDARFVPTPATLQRIDDDAVPGNEQALCRLDPLRESLPGAQPGRQGMLPLWTKERRRTKARGGYISPGGLQRFLRGSVPRPQDIVDPEQLFTLEPRTGIGIDRRTGAAEDSMIYGVTFLRLLPGTALAVEVVGAQEDLDVVPEGSEILQLGGEGRRAVVTRLPNPVTRARDRRRTVESAARPGRTRSGSRHERSRLRQGAEPGPRADGRLVLLTTPGLFNGWKPPKLTVRAAAVPDPVPVSGWDLALRGPKATRFAVPAGSVYFLDHGAEVDSLTSGSRASSEDAAAGWGSFESGEWNHA